MGSRGGASVDAEDGRMGIDLCKLGLCGSGEKGLLRASTEAIMAELPVGVGRCSALARTTLQQHTQRGSLLLSGGALNGRRQVVAPALPSALRCTVRDRGGDAGFRNAGVLEVAEKGGGANGADSDDLGRRTASSALSPAREVARPRTAALGVGCVAVGAQGAERSLLWACNWTVHRRRPSVYRLSMRLTWVLRARRLSIEMQSRGSGAAADMGRVRNKGLEGRSAADVRFRAGVGSSHHGS